MYTRYCSAILHSSTGHVKKIIHINLYLWVPTQILRFLPPQQLLRFGQQLLAHPLLLVFQVVTQSPDHHAHPYRHHQLVRVQNDRIQPIQLFNKQLDVQTFTHFPARVVPRLCHSTAGKHVCMHRCGHCIQKKIRTIRKGMQPTTNHQQATCIITSPRTTCACFASTHGSFFFVRNPKPCS